MNKKHNQMCKPSPPQKGGKGGSSNEDPAVEAPATLSDSDQGHKVSCHLIGER
jgi:hypothetical protein